MTNRVACHVIIYSLFTVPYSLFTILYSLFTILYSLFVTRPSKRTHYIIIKELFL